MPDKKEDLLENVSARVFLDALSKKIKKYEKKHSEMGIITCDVNDVWNWIEKAEKKSFK
jgi:hypothetical protein